MNKLDAVCEAIMHYESFEPGSRSYRHSNPGNLRWSVMQVGSDDGYAIFSSFESGWKALIYDIRSKCLGATRTGLSGESTLLELFKAYAPSSDNNHPQKYAEFVAARAELTVDTKLSVLLGAA